METSVKNLTLPTIKNANFSISLAAKLTFRVAGHIVIVARLPTSSSSASALLWLSSL